MISKYERSKKSVTELSIFRSLTKLITILYNVIQSVQKDIKMTYGYHVLNIVPKCIELVRKSWEESSKECKYNYLCELKENLSDIATHIEMLFQIKAISMSGYARISQELGETQSQTSKWLKSNTLTKVDG